MRVVIIGGTGFVGPHVVERLLARGHAVTVFHRGHTECGLPAEVEQILGDRKHLTDYRSTLARVAPEVVLDTRPLNETDSRILVRTVKGITRRLVALSSGDVYRAHGVIRGTEAGPLEPVPLREDAPLRQRLYPYRGEQPRAAGDPMRWADDYDKILVERVVLGEPDLPGTVLRLPMIYGPGDDQHRLYGYLKRMDAGRPAIVLDDMFACWRWARGYVEDIADAIVLAVADDRAAGRIYNVSDPEALTEADWVRAIGEAAGWRGDVVAVNRDRFPAGVRAQGNFEQHLVYNTDRIRRELGYAEGLSRSEALARTVAWERAHPPESLPAGELDYAVEDEILARIGRNRQS